MQNINSPISTIIPVFRSLRKISPRPKLAQEAAVAVPAVAIGPIALKICLGIIAALAIAFFTKKLVEKLHAYNLKKGMEANLAERDRLRKIEQIARVQN